MARDSTFFARVDAVGKGSKIMISDDVGLNAQIRGWYASVRVASEAGVPGFTIMAGGGSTTQAEDVEIGRVFQSGVRMEFEPSLWTILHVQESRGLF